MKYGGFTTGGLNFDAKVRRESFEPIDLFHAHIGGMDAFARGLKIAAAIRRDGRLADFVKQRYSSWDGGIGAQIEAGKDVTAKRTAVLDAMRATKDLEGVSSKVTFDENGDPTTYLMSGFLYTGGKYVWQKNIAGDMKCQ